MHPSALDDLSAGLAVALAATSAVALWATRIRLIGEQRLGAVASLRWRIGNRRLSRRRHVPDRLVTPLVAALRDGKVHVAGVRARGLLHRRLHVEFDDGRRLELRAFEAAEADRFAQLWHRGDILGVRIRCLPSAGWVVSSAAGRRDATCFSYAATVV